MKINKNKEKLLQRDFNIVKCAKQELNLGTRTIKDKSKYTRKQKYKEIYV